MTPPEPMYTTWLAILLSPAWICNHWFETIPNNFIAQWNGDQFRQLSGKKLNDKAGFIYSLCTSLFALYIISNIHVNFAICLWKEVVIWLVISGDFTFVKPGWLNPVIYRSVTICNYITPPERYHIQPRRPRARLAGNSTIIDVKLQPLICNNSRQFHRATKWRPV